MNVFYNFCWARVSVKINSSPIYAGDIICYTGSCPMQIYNLKSFGLMLICIKCRMVTTSKRGGIPLVPLYSLFQNEKNS